MFGDQHCFTNSFYNIQNCLTALSNRISTISSNLIPNINLPVYLQNYSFSTSSSSQENVLTPYFTIVGGFSTNQSLHRTWNLVTAGTLTASYDQIIFTYNFSGVNSNYIVSTEGPLSGTLIVNGQVYDAAMYFATPKYRKKILTLTLDLSKIPQSTTGGDFYFNIFITDLDTGGHPPICDGYCDGNASCDTFNGIKYCDCNHKGSKEKCTTRDSAKYF